MKVRYLAVAAMGVCRCLFAQDCAVWSGVGAGGTDPALPVVSAIAVYQPPGAPSPVLVVGGAFNSIGGVTARSVAAWDGHEYTALGDELIGSVYALHVFDDGTGSALYAAGRFKLDVGPDYPSVVRWDGKKWSVVGSISGDFKDLETFDDGAGSALWVTGVVDKINGQHVQRDVARWDGNQWSVNANWANQGFGWDLQVHDSGDGLFLFVAGDQGAYQLRGNEWERVGNSLITVRALASFNYGEGLALYASWVYLSRWDGFVWEDLDTNFDHKARSFLVYDNQAGPALVAVGKFSTIGGVPASGIASWDGQVWHAFGAGLLKAGGQGIGNRAAVFDDGGGPALFVVGEFDMAGGVSTPSVARWGCAATCLADCDSSGSLDLFDFLCFTNRFNAADPSADCDADGVLDLFDFLCFVNAFNEGC